MGTSQGVFEPLPLITPQPEVDQDLPNKRAVRKGFRPVFLDATNFLLSDVRGALGPYLNVFLVSQQHWSQTSVGVVTTIGGLLGLFTQVPIGMAIDSTRWKRAIVVTAIAILAVGATVIFAVPTFWPVLFANTLMAVVGDVFAPAIAAITLGFTRALRWHDVPGEMPRSIMPVTSPSRSSRRLSGIFSPSARCFSAGA